jgi:hypothetical protein
MVKLRHKIRFQRLTAPKRLQIMGLTIIVLAGGIATYFTTYISRQHEYFTNRNFRDLASFSDQISSRIENLGDAFKNAVSKTVKEKAVVKNQKAAVASANNCSEADKNKPLKEVFENSLVILAETKFSNIRVERLPEFVDSDQLNASLDDLKVAINVRQEQGESWLELACRNSNSQMPLSFSARLSFTNLINPIIGERKPETYKGNEHEEGFDDVLIARGDDKGDVIYDRRTPELDIVSLSNIPFFETPDKKLDFKTLTTTTSSADIHLAGGDYKFYLQPVSIPLPPFRPSANSNGQVSPDNQSDSNSEVSHWVICGLINASHFRHETWAVSYTVVVFLAFLCALVALSWPLLKLFFIGPKDRLRLADV